MKKALMTIASFLAISAYADDTFFELVETGTPDQVEAAITAGADVNARDYLGQTPLMYAAIIGTETPEVITALIEAGAEVNARNEDGCTPLMCAAQLTETPEVITVLLEAGADGKVKDEDGKDGYTAFDWAEDNDSLKDTDAYRALSDARWE